MSYIQASSCNKRRREKNPHYLLKKQNKTKQNKKKNWRMTHSNACQEIYRAASEGMEDWLIYIYIYIYYITL